MSVYAKIRLKHQLWSVLQLTEHTLWLCMGMLGKCLPKVNRIDLVTWKFNNNIAQRRNFVQP